MNGAMARPPLAFGGPAPGGPAIVRQRVKDPQLAYFESRMVRRGRRGRQFLRPRTILQARFGPEYVKKGGIPILGGAPLVGTALNIAKSFVPGAGMVANLFAGSTDTPAQRRPAPAPAMIPVGYYGPYPVVILTGQGGGY